MPSREEIAQWLRQAATVIEEMHDEYLHDDMVVEYQLFLDRASQVEAMGQQSDPILEELAGALERISEDGHAMLSMTIGSRNRLLAALQKYQQSKVQL